jgi:hypothetical protein
MEEGGQVGLAFPEFHGRFYEQSGFRKIEPHAPDAEDEETIRLLNGQDVRAPEPVA